MTFPPQGPLRQITIQQMRVLRERAPIQASARLASCFPDRSHRSGERASREFAAEGAGRTACAPVIIQTTENLYDLLPTIRSRSIVFQMARLAESEMRAFADARQLPDSETRIALAEGCPGIAASLDLEQFRERRSLVLAAFECGAGLSTFSSWVQHSESFVAKKSEKLEFYLKPAYGLLEDILTGLHGGAAVKNRDVQQRIAAISQAVNFSWIERAVASTG